MYDVRCEISLFTVHVETPGSFVRLKVGQLVHGSGSGLHEAIVERLVVPKLVELETGKSGSFVPEAEAEVSAVVPATVVFTVRYVVLIDGEMVILDVEKSPKVPVMVKRGPVPLGAKEVPVPVNVVFDGRGKGAVLVDTVGSETLSDVVKEVGMMIVIFASVNVLL